MISFMSIKTKMIFLDDLPLLLPDPFDLINIMFVISIGLHNRSGVLNGENDSLEYSYEFREVLVEFILEYRLWLVLVH